jgi:molybdopterin converting factor small subunit
MTRIRFTSFFGERIGGIESVEVDASQVDSALRALTDRYPELSRLVWGADGQLNAVMAVFLNDRQLQSDELAIALQPGDQIDIIPAISGG